MYAAYRKYQKDEKEVIIMKNLTELVFILDRSGSMSGLEADTIGGFNSMIEKQTYNVDTVSGATFSSTGIINAVVDALGKAENG